MTTPPAPTIPDRYDSQLQRMGQGSPGRRIFVQFDPAKHRHDMGRPRVACFALSDYELDQLVPGVHARKRGADAP